MKNIKSSNKKYLKRGVKLKRLIFVIVLAFLMIRRNIWNFSRYSKNTRRLSGKTIHLFG